MPNIFVQPDVISDRNICVTGDNHHHLSKVLRMKAGDKVTVSDNEKHKYITEISTINRSQIDCKILETIDITPPKQRIVLAQAIIKGERMEWIIQKATELGVTEITPLSTERTVVRVDSKLTKKIARWQKIARSAAEQCEREFLPTINPPCLLQNLEIDSDAIGWYGSARGEGSRITDIGNALKSVPIIVGMIGPEGGWTYQEQSHLTSIGAKPITLSPNILRSETAALAFLSQLQLIF